MDSFKFHDVKLEKAKANSKYRKINQRIATLFRFVELFVFIVIISRCFAQFAFSFKLSTDYFRDFSSIVISPKFVFVIGNLIVIALLLLSGQFSANKNGAKIDFYDEYVEECRKTHQQSQIGEEKIESDRIKNKNNNKNEHDKIKMSRSHSGNLERSSSHVHDRRRKLRRSMTERCRKSTVESSRKIAPAAAIYAEDELSNEEFRRTVEAFIERQQRSLREEEGEFSAAAVVSFEK